MPLHTIKSLKYTNSRCKLSIVLHIISSQKYPVCYYISCKIYRHSTKISYLH